MNNGDDAKMAAVALAQGSLTHSVSSSTPPMETSPAADDDKIDYGNLDDDKFCKRPYDGNKEALGWALDAAGRSVSFIAAAVFLGTALLNLAKEAAGCETRVPDGETKVPDCEGRVYGVRPSSFLTTYTTVVGICSAALLPLVGAIIDHTPHRRAVGRWTTLLYCALLFASIFVTKQTWFAIVIVQVALAFVGWIKACVVFAYLPEITDDPRLLVKWMASFTVVQYMSMVLFLVVMIGSFSVLNLTDDEIVSARVSQSASFLITSVTMGISWFHLMGTRPAFHTVPEGYSLLTVGFKKIYRTSAVIRRQFVGLKWFFIAVALSESALQSLATIAITFMTDTLHLNSTENGIAILLMLLSSIPGTYVSTFVTRISDPIRSEQICQFLLATNTAMAAAILTGSGQQIRIYIVAAIWGFLTGWKYTTERYMTCRIIPKGQDAELMGIYLFSGQVLSWLPSLVFTAMNESGVDPRFSIASLDIFFLGSLIALQFMGRFDDVVRVARESDETSSANTPEVKIALTNT